MAITSAFTNIATTTRASKAWDPGAWDFVYGSAVGALVEYAANAPRITSSGLLVEESSTNHITNPRCEGSTDGVIGAGGAMPTNWTTIADEGITEIVGSGTEDGWGYVDLRINGTPTADLQYSFDASTAIVAADGQDWTSSVGLKISAGDTTNVDAIQWRLAERTSGGSLVQQETTTITGIDSTHRRFFLSRTLAGGVTVARFIPQLYINWTSGAIDITLRIYAPQCENKAYPTSPVLPTAGVPQASTRAEEINYIALPASFFDNDGMTIYCEVHGGGKSDAGRSVPWALYLSGSRRLYPYMSASAMVLWAYDGADVISDSTYGVSSTPELHKICVYLSDNDVKWAAKSDSAAMAGVNELSPPRTLAMSTYNKLIIGGSNNIRQLNGYIKDLRAWPRELTDAEFLSLVGI